MDILSIRRIVVAAMVLPSVALGVQSVMIVDTHYRQYQVMEADRDRAELLSSLAQLSALTVPREAENVLGVAQIVTGKGNLSSQRSEVDRGIATVRESFEAVTASLAEPLYEMTQFDVAVARLVSFRTEVDGDRPSNAEVLSVYQSLSLSCLALAEWIGAQVNDPRLAVELRMLFDLLKANEAGLTIAFHGQEYLRGLPWSTRAESSYLATAMLYDVAVEKFGRKSDYRPYRIVADFESSGPGLALADMRKSVSRWSINPSPENDRRWLELQVARGAAWDRAVWNSVTSLRSTSEALALTSERQLHFLTSLIGLFILLIGIVVVLGTKGVVVVGRLIEEREQLVGNLSRAAATDILTGLLNRRGFENAASTLLSDPGLQGKPVSVVLFDLDRFKQVNDVHGHDAGDIVLERLAQLAKTSFRSQDVIARYGGEEFLALLPDTELEAAAAVAERVRLSVEAETIVLPNGTAFSVTASFGCASALSESGSFSLATVIKQADTALYTAKFSGRNRVVIDGEIKDVFPERRTSSATGT
ncbi:diguanylate cyclase [Ciceribacter sp. L1K22]|uniref:diguanylate cyclase n=1 Tax=Ciceribacter sp. L1K22 TaxID=2820275 RepID=UPI001ABE9165|nr:diguanylate cyclase [Ciceribacter sp. L1K22]MBO3758245.1 diguanylate cyclase [Ciceribacter sp. L1K22]